MYVWNLIENVRTEWILLTEDTDKKILMLHTLPLSYISVTRADC